jgi:hypothetical protein
MFVKWKSRRMELCCGRTMSAYLVKSVRTPGGPRHRHICYIASIAYFQDPEGPRDLDEFHAEKVLGDRGFRSYKLGFFAYPPEKVYFTSQTARMAWS